MKYTIAIDETWIYLSNCNKKDRFTTEKEKKNLKAGSEKERNVLLKVLQLLLDSLVAEN